MNVSLPKNINIGLPPQVKVYRNSIMEVGLLVVVCMLLVWFIILPKKAAVDAQQGVLDSYKTDQTKASASLQNVQRLVQQLKSEKDKVQKLDQALPLDSGKTTDVQILIQTLANQSGVTLGDINISANTADAIMAGDTAVLSNPYAPGRSLQKLSGSLYAVGTFSQLQAFLAKLETSGRLIQISALDIQSYQGGVLNLRLTVDAYYLAPPGAVTNQ